MGPDPAGKGVYYYKPVPIGSLTFKQYDKKEPNRDFWNLTGFNFRFLYTRVHLAHMQFFNCGLHNHNSDTFLELHMCLFAGTGNGGMWRVDPGAIVDPDHPDNTNDPNDFIKLPLDSLEEHGAFWHMDCKGAPERRENSSIDYPWHKCKQEMKRMDWMSGLHLSTIQNSMHRIRNNGSG